MRAVRSIRFTLTLWYAVTLAATLVVFCSFLYLTFREQLYDSEDRELLRLAESLASPTLAPFRSMAPASLDQVLEDFIGPKSHDKFVQLVEVDGRPGASTSNVQEIRFPELTAAELRQARIGRPNFQVLRPPQHEPLRLLNYPVMADGRLEHVVQVAGSLEHTSDALDKIFLLLTLSIPAAIFLLSSWGWVLADHALRPVALITEAARRINAENLSQRIEVRNPNDEIGQLAAAFNETLARLDSSFSKTRRFSSDVSHELRTPLTILRGEMEVALRWAKEPEEFRGIMQSCLDEVRRMSEILEFLLDLSRADEGQLALHMTSIDLAELGRAVLHQLENLAGEKGVRLEFVGSEPVEVVGDPQRIRQILLNLLDNAIKHTNPDGVVRLAVAALQGEAQVAVQDAGEGIAASDLPHIFDRFYRVDHARNRAEGGVGLGLAMVKALTEAHGGRVEVASTPGEGSTFTIHLPMEVI